jgi:hypothetical protein
MYRTCVLELGDAFLYLFDLGLVGSVGRNGLHIVLQTITVTLKLAATRHRITTTNNISLIL